MSFLLPSRRALAAFAALAAAGLALTPNLAAAQGSGASRVRVRVSADSTTRDSLIEVGVLGPYGGEVERLLREFAMRRQLEFKIAQQLRALSAFEASQGQGVAVDTRRKQLSDQLSMISRQGEELRSRLVSLCPPESRPQGYMGVSFSGAVQMRRQDDGPVVYRYLEDPVVESVELGSPAEAAGLRRGDRIVLLAGNQARDRDIVFAQLLRPGMKLPMRIERDGRTRDVTLRIGKRPESVQQQCPWMDARIAAAFVEAPQAFTYRFQTEPGQQGTLATGTWSVERPRVAPAPEPPSPPDAPRAGSAVMVAPAAPLPPAPGQVTVMALSSRALVAGAELVRLNEGLRSALGVERGVFVVDVARGTPAAQAGLRGGDVIVRVSGSAVSQPAMVQRIIGTAEEREVPIEVIRERKQVSLVLRW